MRHEQAGHHPRTPEGRAQARYEARVAEARQRVAQSEYPNGKHRNGRSETTPEMAALDDAYVSGAFLRLQDREVKRLRQLERECPVVVRSNVADGDDSPVVIRSDA
jgi:hypothetical protein